MIRQASIEDSRAIAEVHVASWQATYVGQVPHDYLAGLSVPKRENAWRESFTKKDGHSILLSVEDNTVQGFVSFGPSRDSDAKGGNTGEIYAIYLSPDYLGRGVGAQLWRSGTESLKEQQFKDVTVWVLDSNLTARKFYENRGCLLDGGKKPEKIGGQDVLEVRYRVCIK